MEDKEIKIEDDSKRKVTHIELVFGSQEDLIELSASHQFKSFILEESLKSITHALISNLKKAELFNIFNMSVIIEIKRSQFKVVLEKFNSLFLEDEEYERCNELQKLIKKYKL